MGAQVARALGLVEQPVAGPRPREPADGAEPSLRLRGVRRPPASRRTRGHCSGVWCPGGEGPGRREAGRCPRGGDACRDQEAGRQAARSQEGSGLFDEGLRGDRRGEVTTRF
ncbi:Eukaryotic translation initiation factor 4B [Microbacterium sp. Nx66]|nr:Eukaryotic translation initiation factor 4B [Microbacterium sp. Nx66]